MTNQEFLTQLGIEFKVARIRKKLSIEELSKLSKIGRSAIMNLENGKTDGHILTYKRLFDALEMDMKAFI